MRPTSGNNSLFIHIATCSGSFGQNAFGTKGRKRSAARCGNASRCWKMDGLVSQRSPRLVRTLLWIWIDALKLAGPIQMTPRFPETLSLLARIELINAPKHGGIFGQALGISLTKQKSHCGGSSWQYFSKSFTFHLSWIMGIGWISNLVSLVPGCFFRSCWLCTGLGFHLSFRFLHSTLI